MNLLEKLEATAIECRLRADTIDSAIKVVKELGLDKIEKKKKKTNKANKKRRPLFLKMSRARRKEISKRMKAYWAGVRKNNGK